MAVWYPDFCPPFVSHLVTWGDDVKRWNTKATLTQAVKIGNHKWYQWWNSRDNGIATPVPNLLCLRSSTQTTAPCSITDLLKLVGSHKKTSSPLYTWQLSSTFMELNIIQLANGCIFQWLRNVYILILQAPPPYGAILVSKFTEISF